MNCLATYGVNYLSIFKLAMMTRLHAVLVDYRAMAKNSMKLVHRMLSMPLEK